MFRPTAPLPAEAPAEPDRPLLAQKITWMQSLIRKQLSAPPSPNGSDIALVRSILTYPEPHHIPSLQQFADALCSLEEAVRLGTIDEVRTRYARALALSTSEQGDPRKFYEHLLAGARAFEPLRHNGEENLH